MFDKINIPATAIVGIIVVLLTVLTNPDFQGAIITLFSHPTIQQVMTAIGVIAGIALIYIGKPLGTSPASKGP